MTKVKPLNFENLYFETQEAILSPDFYFQFLSVVSCFLASYLCYKFSRNYIFPRLISRTLKKNTELNLLVTRYLVPLLYPVFSLVFLAIGLSIYSNFSKEVIIFDTTLQVTILFLFLRFLRISSDNSFLASAAGIFLFPTLLLDIFGLLDPTIHYLDQYALQLGTFRVSLYLVIKGFTVLLLVFWIANLINKKTKTYIESSKSIKSRTKSIATKFIDITTYSIILVIILKTFGFDLATLAIVGGAVGVGIGFGLQKIASNFISGIILLLEKSVEVGDMVEIDRGDIFGIVKYFGGRYTLVEALDGKEIMIPNEDFIVGKVTNWTYSNSRARIEVNINISYDSDPIKAMKIMTDCASEHPRCLGYPAIECYITNFGEFAINLTLYFWISDIVQGRMGAKSDIMTEVWTRFKENNIKIPLPQREVRFNNKDYSTDPKELT